MKTELDKMISGDKYDSSNKEIINLAKLAEKKVNKFNKIRTYKYNKKRKLLKSLLGELGKDVEIVKPFMCEYGFNIQIKENTFINTGCVILDPAKVLIGKNVSIGPNTQIYTATHPIDPKDRENEDDISIPVKIGDDVFIGGSVVICPGVTIGNGSCIGAGSVVVNDIPANVLAVGNPCRVIKKIVER